MLDVGAVKVNLPWPPPQSEKVASSGRFCLSPPPPPLYLTCETILPDRAVEADRCYFDISIYISSYAEQAVILSEPVRVSQTARCLDPSELMCTENMVLCDLLTQDFHTICFFIKLS